MITLFQEREIPNGRGYVFSSCDNMPILSSSCYLDDKIEKTQKWKIGISLASGCNVKCIYCFSNGLNSYRNLGTDEILAQVDYIKQHPLDRIINQTKIEMKEMGDPAINPKNTYEAIKQLKNEDMIVVSTAGVKNTELFNYLHKANNLANIRLQFSVHTTNDKQKQILSPNLDMMSLEEIAKETNKWPNKVTLTFVPFENYEMSAEKLAKYFNPDKVFVKISYIDDNCFVRKANLTQNKNIKPFINDLEKYGFQYAYRN